MRNRSIEEVDLAAVETISELKEALAWLRGARSYGDLRKALKASGETLSGSTINNLLNGPSKPEMETLRKFLVACGLDERDQRPWFAALDRAVTAHLVRPSGAVRVRDARPRTLGVHAAICVDGAVGEMPTYVPRDFDAELRAALQVAASDGGFVLLVGPSSVGKTRSLFEAIAAVLPDWWLLQPVSGSAMYDLLPTPPLRTVIWLDEVQRFLDKADRPTVGLMAQLLRAGLVVAGTIWPDQYDVRTLPGHLSGPDYAEGCALLDLARVVVVPSRFTPAEYRRAAELSRDEPRLTVAIRAGKPRITQILAAGPDLVRRWEYAGDPCGAAVITAAVDARRLGVESPITVEYLRRAVPGYLTVEQQADAPTDWLEQALAYARKKVKNAASAIIPDSGGSMGRTAGYLAADYLLQHSLVSRRAAVLPDAAWQALVQLVDHPQDVQRLARSADARCRYTYAIAFYRKLADSGDEGAARRLADLLAPRDQKQALNALRPFAAVPYVAGKQTALMIAAGDVDGLRVAAGQGDVVAGCQLLGVLADGNLELLRANAARGDKLAAAWLHDHDADEQHLERLHQRAAAGDRLARGRLAEILAERGQFALAVQALTDTADNVSGNRVSRDHLADLIARNGEIGQAQARTDADGDAAKAAIHPIGIRGGHLALRVSGVLVDQGSPDLAIRVMQAHADAFVETADDYLIDLLVACGRIDLLRARAATGEWVSNERLADLAADAGDLDGLRLLEEEGNWFATRHIVDRMLERGDADEAIDHLELRAAAGDAFAAGHLPDLLSQRDRETELENLARSDPWFASGTWAQHLAATDRLDEAIQWLRDQHGPGAGLAASQLAGLLVDRGNLDEALGVLRAHTGGWGGGPAASHPVELLLHHARVDDLRTEVNSGTSGAMGALLDILRRQESITSSEVDRARARGLSAGWPDDGSPP